MLYFALQCVPILCELLMVSKSISQIYMVECDLSKSLMVDIFSAILLNPHQLKYYIDFASNDLGSKGAKEVADAINKNKEVWLGLNMSFIQSFNHSINHSIIHSIIRTKTYIL